MVSKNRQVTKSRQLIYDKYCNLAPNCWKADGKEFVLLVELLGRAGAGPGTRLGGTGRSVQVGSRRYGELEEV